jgi:hypothetical protein
MPIGRPNAKLPVADVIPTSFVSRPAAAATATSDTPSGANAPKIVMLGVRETTESDPVPSTSSGIHHAGSVLATKHFPLVNQVRPVTRLAVASGAAASPLETITDSASLSSEFREDTTEGSDVSDAFDPVMAGLLGTVNEHPAGFMALSEQELDYVLEAFEQD